MQRHHIFSLKGNQLLSNYQLIKDQHRRECFAFAASFDTKNAKKYEACKRVPPASKYLNQSFFLE
jgi:hypothetical protein